MCKLTINHIYLLWFRFSLLREFLGVFLLSSKICKLSPMYFKRHHWKRVSFHLTMVLNDSTELRLNLNIPADQILE